MSYPKASIFLVIIATILSACGTLSGLMSDIPSGASGMDNIWSEICQHEIVSNFTISYRNTDDNNKQVKRTCSNYVTLRLTPNQEEEKQRKVFSLFTDVCRSEILVSAKLSTKSRTLGHATRNCSR